MNQLRVFHIIGKIFRHILFLIFMVLCSFTAATQAHAADAGTTALIVKLADGLSVEEQAAVIARNGGVESSSIPPLRLHVVVVNAIDAQSILDAYRSDPQVEHVEINQQRRIEATPSDPLFSRQWQLPVIGWDTVFGSITPAATATVAVLDTGVDASHPDLAGIVVPGTSIKDGPNGMSDPNGHGTWVAGIVAAVPNDLGIAGVAYSGVRIMPVTVLGQDGNGQDSDIIAGILYAADHGADVILMSFSNPGFSQNLQDAIDYAWSKNIIVVAATGNSGVSLPSYPAGDRNVIGVSATDASDNLASFSNYGQDAFLAAPGTDILSLGTGSNAYATMSGTSGSAAIVAGTAALMRAVDPALSNGVIAGRLARSADPAGTQEQTGNGRVNMARALADTSTDAIQPTGAPGGGPFVGPYMAAASGAKSGDGSMNVTPSSIAAGSSGNFTFTFISDTGKDFASGSQVRMTIPPTWTVPQGTNAADPGYVSVAKGSCTWVSLPSISSSVVTVDIICPAGKSFTLSYNNAAAPSSVGVYEFTVQSKAPSGSFEILAKGSPSITANGVPSATGIAPASANKLTTVTLVITGTNFISGVTGLSVTPATGIAINSTTVVSSTEMDATITIDQTAATGTVNAVITNPGAGGGTSTIAFQIANPAPTLTAINPTSGDKLQTLDVVFTGTNFMDGVSTVNVGDGITINKISVNKNKNNTQLTANITILDSAAPGVRSFSVTNPGPGGGTSGTQPFTITGVQSQTISVTTPAPAAAPYNSSFTVAATATSGLPVAITTSGACSGSGSGTVSILMTSGTGTCTVYYDQAGNNSYLAAPQVSSTTAAQKAAATVTLGSLTSTYDGTAKTVSATTTPAGLPVSVTYDGSASAPVNAGTYMIIATINDNNYEGSATGSLIINRAPASVTPKSGSKVYGDADPALTGTLIGFVVSDNVTATYSRTSGESVAGSPYTISAALSPAGALANYDITYNTAAFTITPSPLTVTADSLTKILNGPNPTFTFQITGFKFTDGSSSLTAQPVCSSTAILTSPIGSYPITCSSGAAANYSFTYLAGQLKIIYATGGMCLGAQGHAVLQPINPDGTSVFKKGSTVPVKFRVCDANGLSVGPSGTVSSASTTVTSVVTGFAILHITDGALSVADEQIYSTTPDTTFRWSSTDQQWIFNVSTSNLVASRTYNYRIILNDQTNIDFQYGLK